MPPERSHRPAGAYPRPPLPPDEPERLQALEEYDVLDSEPEQAYDDLTLLASHICKTPIALVSLIDSDRQWFKSRVGLAVPETHRDVAFCAHAIVAEKTMVVNDATLDERFARNPLVLGDPAIRFYAGAPLRVPGGQAIGTLCVIDRVPRELTPDQQAALEALSRQVVAQLELRRRISELQQYSARDPLTGVFNRGYFDTLLPVELERSKRYDDQTALLLLDVDGFKQINDRIGHQEGDRVLVLLSGMLTRGVRAADVICRYGGEEFAVILPHTDLEVAGAMADRIREGVATSTAEAEPPLRAGALTVTIGVAAFPADAEDAEQLIAIADRRLYAGKARGRNCVVASEA